MEVYFTADQHFGHDNIIKYANRPFSTAKEMDNALIENWNSVVGPKDDIYHLGDFTLKGKDGAQDYFSRLNGRIHVLPGDHDKKWLPKNIGKTAYLSASKLPVEALPPIYTIEFDIGEKRPLTIVLCHYAMRVWPKTHYGSLHLFGHSHGRLSKQKRSMDIGVDAIGSIPISLDKVIKILLES